MENKKYFLTNKKIKEKVNNNDTTGKIANKESFIYKKANKSKKNKSFDLETNSKNSKSKSKKEKKFSKKNLVEKKQYLYLNNLNDVELFDEPKKQYNKMFVNTQNALSDKNQNYEYKNNKIFNHNENVFDNEQFEIIDNINNKNNGNISLFEKGISYNKIEYNNINQNNSFCVSINNNYNYNFSLNNYNNNYEEDIIKKKNENSWKRKLNTIKEQKKQLQQFNFGKIILDNKNSNQDNKDLYNINNVGYYNYEKGEEQNKIKKFYSTHFLNNNNSSSSSSLIGLLKPFDNMTKKFYTKFFNSNENEINNNINEGINFITKNLYNYNNEENKFKGRIKEFNENENNEQDNFNEDKFTFNINKNNIDNNNAEGCELDVPTSNMINFGNSEQKTAQFPDVINKDNCYKFIPKNLTNDFDYKDNNNISNNINVNNNKNKENKNKIFTRGRYDFLLLKQNNKQEMKVNNSFNNFYYTQANLKNNNNEIFSYNKKRFNDTDSYKKANEKILTYSDKNKNKMAEPVVSIRPKNLFRNRNMISNPNDSIINSNIQEIKFNMKNKENKQILRERNSSFHKSSSNLRKEMNTDINENYLNRNKYYNNNINQTDLLENNNDILSESFLYLKPNKLKVNKTMHQKNLNQIFNKKRINEANYKKNKPNNIKENPNIINSKMAKIDYINTSFYEFNNIRNQKNNSFIIYKKKAENKNKKIEKNNCNEDQKKENNKEKKRSKNKHLNINSKNKIKNKIFKKTMTINHFLNTNINKKNYLKQNNKNNNNEDDLICINKKIQDKNINKNLENSLVLNANRNKSTNISINKKINERKICRITKLNNYYIRIPKIIMINSFITKQYKNKNKIFKNTQLPVCYFSKKYISENINKKQKLNMYYINLNRKNNSRNNKAKNIKEENNINKNLNFNYIYYKNNNICFSERKAKKEDKTKNIIKNSLKRESKSQIVRPNKLLRKFIDTSYNNKQKMNQKFNNEKFYEIKIKTYRNKNLDSPSYFKLLSYYGQLNKKKDIEIIDIHNNNQTKNLENKNNQSEDEDFLFSRSSPKKRRRLGTKIEENDSNNNKNNVLDNIENKIIAQIKEDLNNYCNNKTIRNEKNWSKILLLFKDFSFYEICKIFIQIYNEELNDNYKKENSYEYKEYIRNIIESYLEKKKEIDIEKIRIEIKNIFKNIFSSCDYSNQIILEIIGYLLFIFIENKYYNIEDLKDAIINNEALQNKIIKIIKYIILSSGNKKEKYYEDFKTLYKDNDIYLMNLSPE